jgi:hypothetical protein
VVEAFDAGSGAGAQSKRRIALELDDFGRWHVEAIAERRAQTVDEFVRQATLYLLAVLDRGGIATLVPRFWQNVDDERPRAATLNVAFELAQEEWLALQEECRRQRVSLAALARHAVLWMLADLDAT